MAPDQVAACQAEGCTQRCPCPPPEPRAQPPRAWHSLQEKPPPAHGSSPYDVGGRFPLLGQELGIVNNLLQKADHSELQLLVGFKVLPKAAQPRW